MCLSAFAAHLLCPLALEFCYIPAIDYKKVLPVAYRLGHGSVVVSGCLANRPGEKRASSWLPFWVIFNSLVFKRLCFLRAQIEVVFIARPEGY